MGQTMQDLVLRHASHDEMAFRFFELTYIGYCYYFGCDGYIEHDLHHGHGSEEFAFRQEILITNALGSLNGKFCWNSLSKSTASRDETEGLAYRTYRDGWTAVAFWDRSVDKRPNSNSAFIVAGDRTFAQVVRAARRTWPKIWARFTFEVVEVDAQGERV